MNLMPVVAAGLTAAVTLTSAFALPSQAAGTPTRAPSLYPEGESLHALDVNGVRRSFLVYVPAGLDAPRAAVFVLHGGGGEGLGAAVVGRHPLGAFRAMADREGIVVVYPEGLPANDRQGNVGWNDCRADNRVSSGADDVGFLRALVTTVGKAYQLPRTRLFMAGSSNGAQMTQAFALHHPELLRAVASSAGNLPASPLPGPCTARTARPIPILLVHGTADTQMPYTGGCVVNLGGTCNRGRVVSAIETRDRWRAINGVRSVKPTKAVVKRDSTDGGDAHRFVYRGSAPVEWWRLDGAGHAAPSRTVPIQTSALIGIQNRDIEFADVAWSFFERQLPAR